MFSYFLYLFKELQKKASEFSSRLEWWMVANSTVMALVALFKSKILKMATAKEKKITYRHNLNLQYDFKAYFLKTCNHYIGIHF